MNKRIVVLGDSLSMPRPGIDYEDTYPYLLQTKGYEVICRSKRGNDTNIQTLEQNILDDLIFLNPDIVVVHLGIVDCAPRLFSRKEQRVLSFLPTYLRNKIINFFSKRRFYFTKLRNLSYVSENKFTKNLNSLIDRIDNSRKQIILIKILNTTSENEKKSFGFKEKINTYNDILQKLAIENNITIIDPNYCEDSLSEDGIHITCEMNEYLKDKLFKAITKV